MLLTVATVLTLLSPPPCVAVSSGKLNVEGDSTAIAIASALERHGYLDQPNCVVATVERRTPKGPVTVWLVLLATVYRPALVVIGAGEPAAAVDTAAAKLAQEVRFWQPCWSASRVPQDGWRRVYSDQQYAALCDLIAGWLRP